MKKILVIAEKEMAARRIAQILSGGKSKREKINDTYGHTFYKDGDKYCVLGLKGHIISIDYPKEFNRWDSVKPENLIEVDPIQKYSEWKIISGLKRAAKEYEEIIIATDYDREGELIGVEALSIIRSANKNIKVKRARFSAITPNEVKNAFNNLTDVDYNLADSAYARQIIDLAWGATLTRFISIISNQRGKDFLSVGRVQTPTLTLIVDREEEIKNFISKPYWEVFGNFKKEKKEFDGMHEKNPFWDREKAEKSVKNAKNAKKGKIIEAKKEKKKYRPPIPFNTTQFLVAAASLGISAPQAMSIAEELYMSGYISYPRTDNTEYPKSLDIKGILKELSKDKSPFKDLALEILSYSHIKPTHGKIRTTDHPPIHPVSCATHKDLKGNQWRIYELIVRRFLATLAKDAIIESNTVKTDVNGEIFQSKGQQIVYEGWRKFYPYQKLKETILPELNVGDIVNVENISMRKKMTKPPPRYSQGSLIQEMERLGLGTKATRHEIIQKLYARDYIRRKNPVPTETGIAVAKALKKYSEMITKPNMTSQLEKEMDAIAEGKKKLKDVVNDSRMMLTRVMKILNRNKYSIGEAIKHSLIEKNTIGKCPSCDGNLVVKKSRAGKRFVACGNYPSCRTTFSLPQNGKVMKHDKECEICGMPQVKIMMKNRKTWTICINPECDAKKKKKS